MSRGPVTYKTYVPVRMEPNLVAAIDEASRLTGLNRSEQIRKILSDTLNIPMVPQVPSNDD